MDESSTEKNSSSSASARSSREGSLSSSSSSATPTISVRSGSSATPTISAHGASSSSSSSSSVGTVSMSSYRSNTFPPPLPPPPPPPPIIKRQNGMNVFSSSNEPSFNRPRLPYRARPWPAGRGRKIGTALPPVPASPQTESESASSSTSVSTTTSSSTSSSTPMLGRRERSHSSSPPPPPRPHWNASGRIVRPLPPPRTPVLGRRERSHSSSPPPPPRPHLNAWGRIVRPLPPPRTPMSAFVRFMQTVPDNTQIDAYIVEMGSDYRPRQLAEYFDDDFQPHDDAALEMRDIRSRLLYRPEVALLQALGAFRDNADSSDESDSSIEQSLPSPPSPPPIPQRPRRIPQQLRPEQQGRGSIPLRLPPLPPGPAPAPPSASNFSFGSFLVTDPTYEQINEYVDEVRRSNLEGNSPLVRFLRANPNASRYDINRFADYLRNHLAQGHNAREDSDNNSEYSEFSSSDNDSDND
jgi:hypothetical protein